jgi:hypothetical protein
MNRGFCIAFCFGIMTYAGCSHKVDSPKPAFYFWKTNFSLNHLLRAHLDSIGAQKIYVKFFDVDWDEHYNIPVPLAEVVFDTANLKNLNIVPCIFITNRTIVRSSFDEMEILASQIIRKIDDYRALLPDWTPAEIQIDCDWTAGTRARYFSLLHGLNAEFASKGIVLSATVRLHQYKYPDRTGVPPVPRGMLMCYNTGNVEDWSEENSILRSAVLEDYLEDAENYPLPLDLALPVFQWGVLFRDGRMIRLLHGLGAEVLLGDARFQPLAKNRFAVQKSTFLEGHYLYRGDQIRLENLEEKELKESCRLLKKVYQKGATLAWFHLDSLSIRQFPAQTLNALWQN